MNLDLIDFLAVLAVIFSCLSGTSVIHYDLWFLFACYHKRNVETKRLKAVSSSRPLSAILTQVGHYIRVGRRQEKKAKKKCWHRTKTVPDITSLSYKYKYQQIRDNNATWLLFTFYWHFIKSWDIFTAFTHLLQLLHKSINWNCDHQSHTWRGFMTSTKVTLEI